MIRRLFLATCVLFTASLHAQDDTATTKPKVIQSTATDDLKAAAGQQVTVEGKVARIGATSGGGITFINMAPGANSFVAVVFKPNLAQFPDGFDKYKNQTLRVTGKIIMYKETTPEIEVRGPDQIEVVAADAATATVKPE
jgi:DNA/RNA endonuclease YhcR with UshA esterase domain